MAGDAEEGEKYGQTVDNGGQDLRGDGVDEAREGLLGKHGVFFERARKVWYRPDAGFATRLSVSVLCQGETGKRESVGYL